MGAVCITSWYPSRSSCGLLHRLSTKLQGWVAFMFEPTMTYAHRPHMGWDYVHELTAGEHICPLTNKKCAYHANITVSLSQLAALFAKRAMWSAKCSTKFPMAWHGVECDHWHHSDVIKMATKQLVTKNTNSRTTPGDESASKSNRNTKGIKCSGVQKVDLELSASQCLVQ